MREQEVRGLYEAYMEVYSVDEGLGSAIKRVFGGKKEVEAPKPESRGAELRRKYSVGPEKSDTSAKRQILDRSRARAERDEKDYGDSKYSKSVATKSADAHNRYLKAGYSKYGAGDARGRGSKAAKRKTALNREEFDLYDIILSHLLDEGYAETPEAAEAIMVNMGEEWREDIVEGMTMKDFKSNRRKLQRKEASDDAKKRGHVDKFTGKPYGTEEAASRRKDIHSPSKAPEREARRKFAEDPD
jgi:hypothetical protein